MRLDFDGEDVEQREHFPSEEHHRNDSHRDCQDFAEIKIAAPGLETSRHQAEDVQGRKAEYEDPEDVVDIALLAGKLIGKLKCEEQR